MLAATAASQSILLVVRLPTKLYESVDTAFQESPRAADERTVPVTLQVAGRMERPEISLYI